MIGATRNSDIDEQIIGIADTGVDFSNCLLSENPMKDPPFQGSDLLRRKIVGYHSNEDCALCDGCPKVIMWDRMRFGGANALLNPSQGRSIFVNALIHISCDH